jgi:hypothetical protein
MPILTCFFSGTWKKISMKKPDMERNNLIHQFFYGLP